MSPAAFPSFAPATHQAVIVTPGCQYQGKTTSLLGQRWSRSPHLCSAPLCSSLLEWTYLLGNQVTLVPGLACPLENTGGSH